MNSSASKPSSLEPSDPSCDTPSSLPPLPVFLTAAAAAALCAYLLYRRSPPPHRPQPAACALTRAWLAIDPDPETREQLSSWLTAFLANPSNPALSKHLPHALDPCNRLQFGTAGIRASQGVGYNRLNCVVIIGIGQAIVKVRNVSESRVVIGHDARTNSRKYAVLLADIFASAGAHVMLFSRPVPTPFVSYAVTESKCIWGLCVTASHNPPEDNGVKVFADDGIQIRPDVAKRIEARVREFARPWKTYALTDDDLPDGKITDPFHTISAKYYDDMSHLCLRKEMNATAPRVVYTACHGIGYPFIKQIFTRFSLPEPVPCIEQVEPDPEFPTLPFPNPEEKGALNLAIATAKREQLQLVLANDPDADRLGAAELQDHGDVKIFTGDEMALLLADYLTTFTAPDRLKKCGVVASTVSSKVLQSMAKKRGFQFREGLTGFKWINKAALDMQEEGIKPILTYEEAIGYNITGNIVRDKDGVSAAAVFAEMAGYLYQSGGSLTKRLSELLQECGAHIAYNGYLRLSSSGSPSTKEVFESARERGLPDTLGKARVVSIRDLTYGTDTAEEGGKARLASDPASQFLTFRCNLNSPAEEINLVIHLRGSGTGKLLLFFAAPFLCRSDFLTTLS